MSGIVSIVYGRDTVCPELSRVGPDSRRFLADEKSRPPHHADCRVELVGLLEGVIANGESLRTWLLQRGHVIVSGSDGEILTHLVEDHYSSNAKLSSSDLARMRQAYACSKQRACMPDGVLRMIDSIRKADAIVEGSYAAFIVEPKLPGIFAIRSGAELFAASGVDENGEFAIASSDMAAISVKTHRLIPLAEGEGLWFSEISQVRFMLGGSSVFLNQAL